MSSTNFETSATAGLPVITEEIRYASSVDGVTPLVADVAFAREQKPKPMVAVMHGYSGSRGSVQKDLRDLAARGLFCVAPDMRGRGDSAGRWDSGGLDVHDIVDALLAAAAKYAAETDIRNINIIGYSGGGGNCYLAVARFPDIFHVSAPFFGISDYALWHETKGRPDCNKIMEETLGGSPQEIPLAYAARNVCPAAGNSRQTRWHIFWDATETGCPPVLNERFLDAYRSAGLSNAAAHVSRDGDAARWFHDYRTDNPMLEKADELLAKEIFSSVPDLSLPPRGSLVVCGYLVCRHFQVFVEDGRQGAVKIAYDLSGAEPRVAVTENAARLNVRISIKTPLSAIRNR